MTTEVMLAIVAGIVTLGTLYLNQRNNKREEDAKMERAVVATDQNAKLDGIHVLVNSRLTRALNKITRLEEHISKITGEPFSPDPEDDITPVTEGVTPVLPDMLPTIVPTPGQPMLPATVPHTVDPVIPMLPDPAVEQVNDPPKPNIHYRADDQHD